MPVRLALDTDAPRFPLSLAIPATRMDARYAAGGVVVPCAAMTS
jgi:hypothetical protein